MYCGFNVVMFIISGLFVKCTYFHCNFAFNLAISIISPYFIIFKGIYVFLYSIYSVIVDVIDAVVVVGSVSGIPSFVFIALLLLFIVL